jgi:hypothetical protein
MPPMRARLRLCPALSPPQSAACCAFPDGPAPLLAALLGASLYKTIPGITNLVQCLNRARCVPSWATN